MSYRISCLPLGLIARLLRAMGHKFEQKKLGP